MVGFPTLPLSRMTDAEDSPPPHTYTHTLGVYDSPMNPNEAFFYKLLR